MISESNFVPSHDLYIFYICIEALVVETKNQWARDDPAFVILLTIFLLISSISYAIAFNGLHLIVPRILWLILWTLVIDFFLYGFAIATASWALVNKFMRLNPSAHTVEQSVEWLYAFDIHCNAFFTTYLTLYVGQYLLLPFIYREGILAALVANALYLISIAAYFYITFLGYQALPFVDKAERFLFPVVLGVFVCTIATLMRVNLCVLVMNFYFG